MHSGPKHRLKDPMNFLPPIVDPSFLHFVIRRSDYRMMANNCNSASIRIVNICGILKIGCAEIIRQIE